MDWNKLKNIHDAIITAIIFVIIHTNIIARMLIGVASLLYLDELLSSANVKMPLGWLYGLTVIAWIIFPYVKDMDWFRRGISNDDGE